MADPHAADRTCDLRVARDGRVMMITIDRPSEANRITPEALTLLKSTCAALANDGEVQAVVITGAGEEFFSSGILNPAVRASLSKEQVLDLVELASDAYDALEAVPQIVIAALNGKTRAGAAELALACDIRLAAKHAALMFPEAQWGGFPGAGGPVRLPALVGLSRALELMCTGREIDAAEMDRIGFVQGVYPVDQLLGAARELARRIAGNGPLATRGAKRIARMRLSSGAAEASRLARDLRRALEWSADVDEGIAAHREGRSPRFTGR
jgi:enoyl-CoA hydratase